MIVPVRTRNGDLYSYIIENKVPILVAISPMKLILDSLEYYFKNMKSAYAGSRSILGNIKSPPLNISSQLEIFWFPTMSPTHEDCIWLAYSHIADSFPKGSKKTEILLKSGYRIQVDISKSVFDERYRRTIIVKHISIERHTSAPGEVIEPNNKPTIYKCPKKNKYIIEGLEDIFPKPPKK